MYLFIMKRYQRWYRAQLILTWLPHSLFIVAVKHLCWWLITLSTMRLTPPSPTMMSQKQLRSRTNTNQSRVMPAGSSNFLILIPFFHWGLSKIKLLLKQFTTFQQNNMIDPMSSPFCYCSHAQDLDQSLIILFVVCIEDPVYMFHHRTWVQSIWSPGVWGYRTGAWKSLSDWHLKKVHFVILIFVRRVVFWQTCSKIIWL